MSYIDWEKEAGNEFQVYPEGTYKISINGFEIVTASTGTKQVRWKATILEPKEYVGKPLTTHTALTEKSLWRLARLVKACGVDLKSAGKTEIGSAAFMQVLDACKRRTSYWLLSVSANQNGKPRNEVDDFKVDTEQQEMNMIGSEDDTPEFLKGA